jgi:hypothetical protein
MSKKARTKAIKSIPVPPLHEDQVKALDIRTRLGKALEPVCLILDEAKACGFVLSFNLKDDATGARTLVNGIQINRKL